MWNFLKFNLFAIAISLIGVVGGGYIAYLGQSYEIVIAIFMTIVTLSTFMFFMAIAGLVADFWKVFVQGGEVEGFSWKPKSKSTTVSTQPIQTDQPKRTWEDLGKENIAKKSFSQPKEQVKTQQNQFAPTDPLGIR